MQTSQDESAQAFAGTKSNREVPYPESTHRGGETGAVIQDKVEKSYQKVRFGIRHYAPVDVEVSIWNAATGEVKRKLSSIERWESNI